MIYDVRALNIQWNNYKKLQLQLRASPVTSLCVVSDFVASTHSNPLRDGAILLQLFRQFLFDSECLMGRHILYLRIQ